MKFNNNGKRCKNKTEGALEVIFGRNMERQKMAEGG
jgi:hypothetical protein